MWARQRECFELLSSAGCLVRPHNNLGVAPLGLAMALHAGPMRAQVWATETELIMLDLLSLEEPFEDRGYSVGPASWGTHPGQVLDLNMQYEDTCEAAKNLVKGSGSEPWVDEDFPPEDSSLFLDAEQPPPEDMMACPARGREGWRRLGEVYQHCTPVRNASAAGIMNVMQGGVGDCYLIGGIAIMANSGVSAENRVVASAPSWMHAVVLYITGRWRAYYVDDYVPVKPSTVPGREYMACGPVPTLAST